MKKTILTIAAAVVLGAATIASAQTTGNIAGTVKDTGGAVVAGVKVTAVNNDSHEQRTTVTNRTGEYGLPSMTPGDYQVRFEHAGFAPTVESVTLSVTEHIVVDAVLSLSSVSTTVQVDSQGPLLQADSPVVGVVIDGTAVSQLPLATRNFTQLLALAPGTSAPLNDATSLGRGTQSISANGARTGSNAIYIDGVDAINLHINSAGNNAFASNGAVIPSPDAIQEFKIQTALYDALTGRSGGANIAVITRSGSNAIHGTLFEVLRNDLFNANSYFVKQTGQPRPELKQNQFGGTVGGPIRKDKLFYFFSYQGTRQRNAYAGTTTIILPPIPTTRTAAAICAVFCGMKTSHNGPVITLANINPVALAALNLKNADGSYVMPSPQTTNTTGINYTASVPSSFNEDQYVGSITWQLGKNDHLAFHAIVANQPQFNSMPLGPPSPTGTGPVPGFGTHQLFKSGLYSINETHLFSSSLVNEARIGLSRLSGGTGFQNQIPMSTIGMTRFNAGDFPDIPEIELSGSYRFGYSVNADQADTENTFQYFDTLSWVKGRHNFNFGTEIRRYQDNYFSNNRMRGSIDFTTFPNFLLGLSGNSIASGGNGTGFSDLFNESVGSGIVQRYDRITDYAIFAQDAWHPSSRVTVNYGVRWERIGLPVDLYGRNGSFEPQFYIPAAPGGYTSAGFVQESNSRNPVPGIPKVNPTLINGNSNKNFGPRIGMEFQSASNVVWRAGYGLYYDRLSNQLGLLESLSVPNYVRSDLSAAANINASLASPFPALPTRAQFPIVPKLYSLSAQNGATNPPITINDVDPNLRTPYYQQWGLSVQIQMTQNLMAEIGYVGARGVALPIETFLNQPGIASPTNPINGVTTNSAAGASDGPQARVPYQGFAPTGIIYLQTRASSNYNSLQATLKQRMHHGLQFSTSYTFSKSLDNASGTADGSTFNNFDGDQTNLGGNYGPSDFNRTNHFSLNFVYLLPAPRFAFVRTRTGSAIFRGWQVSGVAVAQSGLPFNIEDNGGAAFYGTSTSHASYANGANANTALKSGRTQTRLLQYFNTAAFVSGGNLYGNVGRNTMIGPTQRNFDLALVKRQHLAGGIKMEFRAEAFNLFNVTNFAPPDNDIGTAATFGVISRTLSNPRILQFGLKLTF